MTYEEFSDFYNRYGKYPNDLGRRKNPLNENQLKRRYEKYLKSEEKKQAATKRKTEKVKNSQSSKVDDKWIAVLEQVRKRDGYRCRLLDKVTEEEKSEIKRKSYGFHKLLDCAHVFGRGAYPHMKYNVDNVVLLNRYSHSCLDQGRDPITGEQISPERLENWWRFIVGDTYYDELLNKAKRRNIGG